MCGIAGTVQCAHAVESTQVVELMLGKLQRRGPDDSGVHAWSKAILGHRRLSIFDLTGAGHQPMTSEDGNVGIVFNGAIYNFRALRSELISKGHRFLSRTDTEVLVNGYIEWGIDGLLSRVDGMFAFGLWDNDCERLFLVRDRLGVKPLAFRKEGKTLHFASTVGALKKGGGHNLDPLAVAEYLEFGFITDEHSIYQGINKVRPGEIVEWVGGEITRRQYWQLAESETQTGVSFEEAVEDTERLFLDAVEKRLQADVAVGALLSGGIDSSLVCWAVGRLGGDATAFTVATPGEDVDEAPIAVDTAKRLGVRHKLLQLAPSAENLIYDLVDAFDEPFGAPSALAMLSISKEVRQFATVLLTGDGGDDVFLGYPEHRHFHLSQRLSRLTPAPAADAWNTIRSVVPRVGILKRGASFLDYSVGGLGAVGTARDGFPFYVDNGILGGRLCDVRLSHREMEWALESGRDLLARFLSYDRVTRFVGEYLTKVDRATMYHALEARSPFLDVGLWEYAHSLPYTLHLNQGRSKAILREIARRRIGADLAYRKKQGFVIPALKWLSQSWRPAFDRLMSESILGRHGWIDAVRVRKILADTPSTETMPRQMWFIFVLESWLRHEGESG